MLNCSVKSNMYFFYSSEFNTATIMVWQATGPPRPIQETIPTMEKHNYGPAIVRTQAQTSKIGAHSEPKHRALIFRLRIQQGSKSWLCHCSHGLFFKLWRVHTRSGPRLCSWGSLCSWPKLDMTHMNWTESLFLFLNIYQRGRTKAIRCLCRVKDAFSSGPKLGSSADKPKPVEAQDPLCDIVSTWRICVPWAWLNLLATFGPQNNY